MATPDIAKLVHRSREIAGLPPVITDDAVLNRIAEILSRTDARDRTDQAPVQVNEHIERLRALAGDDQ